LSDKHLPGSPSCKITLISDRENPYASLYGLSDCVAHKKMYVSLRETVRNPMKLQSAQHIGRRHLVNGTTCQDALPPVPDRTSRSRHHLCWLLGGQAFGGRGNRRHFPGKRNPDEWTHAVFSYCYPDGVDASRIYVSASEAGWLEKRPLITSDVKNSRLFTVAALATEIHEIPVPLSYAGRRPLVIVDEAIWHSMKAIREVSCYSLISHA